MDIITITEMNILKLEHEGKSIDNEQLRQNVKGKVMIEKPPMFNIDRNTWKSIQNIRNNDNVDIQPFDNGNRFVQITHHDALEKIENELGSTTILNKDPTRKNFTKFQRLSCNIKKETNITIISKYQLEMLC